MNDRVEAGERAIIDADSDAVRMGYSESNRKIEISIKKNQVTFFNHQINFSKCILKHKNRMKNCISIC